MKSTNFERRQITLDPKRINPCRLNRDKHFKKINDGEILLKFHRHGQKSIKFQLERSGARA